MRRPRDLRRIALWLPAQTGTNNWPRAQPQLYSSTSQPPGICRTASFQPTVQDIRTDADTVSTPLAAVPLDVRLTFILFQPSRCLTPTVTGRVRATCSSGASRVRTRTLLVRPTSAQRFVSSSRTWPHQALHLPHQLPYW